MSSILMVLAGAAAMAGPVPALEVKVPIVGRDDTAVKADIRKAATEVCRDSVNNSIIGAMNEHRCRYRVIVMTEARLAEARATNARVLAQNAPAK